ncbi:MAG: helix-turn-helix domain-containing protein, partial [Proteobacteria bacterium]|nr:helix-turn-helix domain-containing protein [Pseudomonadota bacterium]
MDLLRKGMNARQGGMSKAKAAEVFGIDPKTIYNWEQRADL